MRMKDKLIISYHPYIFILLNIWLIVGEKKRSKKLLYPASPCAKKRNRWIGKMMNHENRTAKNAKDAKQKKSLLHELWNYKRLKKLKLNVLASFLTR